MKSVEQLRPYQFKKGQSGNPSGRPKSRFISSALNKKLLTNAIGKNGKTLDKAYVDLMIDRMVKDAIEKGNTDMIRIIMGYIEGAPQEYLDITTDGESINQGSSDIMEMVKRINQELKLKKTKQL